MGVDVNRSDASGGEIARFEHPRGSELCCQSGCLRTHGVRCNHIDGRGRRCVTTWCPDHWSSVGGIVYCRRHANTIVAIGGVTNAPLALPDLDNRGPSLVNWVYGDIDSGMQQILTDCVGTGQRIVRDSAVTVVFDTNRRRFWERSWKLLDAVGNSVHRITVAVFEANDALVILRVDDHSIAQGVPPWIDRHRRRVEVTPSADELQRKLFYGFLLEHVPGALVDRLAVHAS